MLTGLLQHRVRAGTAVDPQYIPRDSAYVRVLPYPLSRRGHDGRPVASGPGDEPGQEE